MLPFLYLHKLNFMAMKKILPPLFVLFFSHNVFASGTNYFITKWDLTKYGNSNAIFFRAIASGVVNYTWEEIGGSAAIDSGSFYASSTTASPVIISGLPSNAIIRLKIDPTNFLAMFSSNSNQQLIDVSQWGNGTWLYTQGMFWGCVNLDITATDIPNFSNVTNMNGMFEGCYSLKNLLSINNWDVSSVTNMSDMFNGARKFNISLNNWNVSNVLDMSGMFSYTDSFNQPLNNWTVSSVTDMSNMFFNAKSFNQPLNNWDISSVVSLQSIFAGSEAFNQPLNNWNVNNTVDMRQMFTEATSFNQTLAGWDFNQNVDFTNCLYFSGLNCVNYDNTLIGWSNKTNFPTNRNLGTVNLHYSSLSQSAHYLLTQNKGLLISEDTFVVSCLLPITLTSFTATPHENKVLLQWQTATETNNAFFSVQKSNNGKDWQNMATVKGSGNSSTIKTYNTTDSKPFNGINYYRIKQTDNNGSYTFSQIKQVTINDKQQTINIYPNPAKDVVYINCVGMKVIKIIDQLGQVIQQMNNITTEHQTINTKQFAKGVYAVVVETANGVVTKKMVKE